MPDKNNGVKTISRLVMIAVGGCTLIGFIWGAASITKGIRNEVEKNTAGQEKLEATVTTEIQPELKAHEKSITEYKKDIEHIQEDVREICIEQKAIRQEAHDNMKAIIDAIKTINGG